MKAMHRFGVLLSSSPGALIVELEQDIESQLVSCMAA